MYDMVLRQYLHYYQNYDVTLDHFLTGLDTLGTGRLTFQVLDCMVFSSLFAGWRESSEQSISSPGEPCKSTREISEPCSPVLKEAQPRPSS